MNCGAPWAPERHGLCGNGTLAAALDRQVSAATRTAAVVVRHLVVATVAVDAPVEALSHAATHRGSCPNDGIDRQAGR